MISPLLRPCFFFFLQGGIIPISQYLPAGLFSFPRAGWNWAWSPLPFQVVLGGVNCCCRGPVSPGSPSERKVSDGAWEVPPNSTESQQWDDTPERPQSLIVSHLGRQKCSGKTHFPKCRRQDHKGLENTGLFAQRFRAFACQILNPGQRPGFIFYTFYNSSHARGVTLLTIFPHMDTILQRLLLSVNPSGNMFLNISSLQK